MYAADYRGARLTFEVAGLWRRNLVLRDRETGTLWQQETGAAIAGPLEGIRLQLLEGVLATADGWRREQPNSTYAPPTVPWPGRLPQSLTGAALHMLDPVFRRAGITPADHRLPPATEVVGVIVDRVARAYPLAYLQTAGTINEFVAGQALTLVYSITGDRVVVLRRPYAALQLTLVDGRLIESSPYDGTRPPHRWSVTGNALTNTAPDLSPYPHRRLYWAGWYEFHPETDLFQPT